MSEKRQDALLVAQTERDEAVAWIRVVGEEINSGGDRDATLKKIRMLRAAYEFADHTYYCGHKSGGKCNCGFDAVFSA